MTKLLLLVFGKGQDADARPTEKNYETVVSRFQIQTLAEACRILGINSCKINVECFYGSSFQAENMPFELRIFVKFRELELHIYTDGAGIGGEKVDIRFEKEGYDSLVELRADFLKELKTFL